MRKRRAGRGGGGILSMDLVVVEANRRGWGACECRGDEEEGKHNGMWPRCKYLAL